MEDVLYRFLGLYKKSPPWVKNTAGSVYGLLPYSVRFGRAYTNYHRLARAGNQWSAEQHREFQFRKLQALIGHAFANVPYYREKYSQAGLEAGDFRSLEDFRHFPMLTREEISEHRTDLVAKNLPESLRLVASTSGSSGVPLTFFRHKGVSRPKERAFLREFFESFGYTAGCKSVILRGEVIENEGQPWYYDPIDKSLIFSSYQLSEETVADYCREIRKHRPDVIRGYPFMVFKLVQLMRKAGEAPFDLTTVVLESENVYARHRIEIAEFFACPVRHYYGHTEALVWGGNCTQSESYHIHPEYGYLEVLDEGGAPVAAGTSGEVVATGFDNMVMPLIRYRTQDTAERGGDTCACGKQFPLLTKIMGRADEHVFLGDGSRVPFHNLLAGIHGDTWGRARKIQCIQTQAGRLLVRVVPAPELTGEAALAVFIGEINQRIPREKLLVEGEVVVDIPATRSGKTKLFVTHLE